MRSRHIAFLLEQAYGHIIPTLGIAMELMRRGYRVSYAVTPDFVPAIHRSGAQAVVFNPIDTRTETLQLAASPGGTYEYDLSRDLFLEQVKDAKDRRTASSLSQLQERYRHDRPDLVVHNDYLDVAGRTLAKDWGIARVRLHSRAILPAEIPMFADDSLVLVLVPRFFNGDVGLLDERFQFVGFISEGRNEIAQPWPHSGSSARTILASTSTGLPNQAEFCRLMMKAFGAGSFDVVLSVPGDFDPLSAIDSASIGDLPENFRLNKYSAHLEILKDSCLYIGQGGPGSTLEALYSGVPVILIPPTRVHDAAATRVAELGLGLRLSVAEATPDHLRACAETLIRDAATIARVKDVQTSMHATSAARTAADLIESRIP